MLQGKQILKTNKSIWRGCSISLEWQTLISLGSALVAGTISSWRSNGHERHLRQKQLTGFFDGINFKFGVSLIGAQCGIVPKERLPDETIGLHIGYLHNSGWLCCRKQLHADD